jgi:Asp/Glu/hydantoin racemase
MRCHRGLAEPLPGLPRSIDRLLAAEVTMRIWHQSSTEIDGLPAYRRSLLAHAAKMLDRGDVVEVHGIPAGRYRGRAPSDALGNAFVHHVVLEPVLANAVRAEAEGCDAFVIGSFSEPFLRELRSAVDIPVVSLTEASLLVACSLGRYSAPISNAPTTAWMTRMSIEAHGLAGRVLRVQAIDPPLDEPQLARAFDDPAPVIESFMRAAQRAVADGADSIIPAEGMLAELLHSQGVTTISGAPVVDVFGTAWAYAAMLVRLRRHAGMQVGRAWHYRRDDAGLVRELALGARPIVRPPSCSSGGIDDAAPHATQAPRTPL